ncbi:unnamed protein product [Closterium sp. NIES-54]
MAGPWRAILRVAAVLCALHVATAQFEAPEFNIAVRKADIPFIKCDVCRKMAEQLDQQVEREREKAEPKKVRVGGGRRMGWGKGDGGGEHEEDGECLSECKTIQRACQDIMGEHDTDIAERIFNDEPSQSSLQRHLCHDLSKACSSKPPPVPQDREPGENWQKKDTSPPDYSKMAKEMNIPTSVMHDEVGRSTTPRITAPVHTCTHAHRKEKDTSPPDYSKMAKEMNIPTSVMHDEVRGGVMQHIGVHWMHGCTDACTHALMHTCTHAHMRTCTHAHMHTCAHAHMRTCTHAHMHTCAHAHMRTCTHAHMHTGWSTARWLRR